MNNRWVPEWFRRAVVLATLLAASLANAADFPTRPIKIIVPYTAGSGTDAVARSISDHLQADLGVAIVVENRPGANGTIGTAVAAKSPPDGYTLIVAGATTHSSAPSLFTDLQYDPARDFEMLVNLVEAQFVLVVKADSPAKDVAGLKALIKAKGDATSYGYGTATSQIGSAAFLKRNGLNATGVAYKSNPQAVLDILNGNLDFMVLDQTVALGQIKAGTVRALAVASPKRMKELPDVPTFDEVGMRDFYLLGWTGVLAPVGLPKDVADRLYAALTKAMVKDSVMQRLSISGRPLPPEPRSREGLNKQNIWPA